MKDNQSTVVIDLLGKTVEIGDKVVYGKSSRHNPLGIGRVQAISEKGVTILGDGNYKPGTIPLFNARERIVVIG